MPLFSPIASDPRRKLVVTLAMLLVLVLAVAAAAALTWFRRGGTDLLLTTTRVGALEIAVPQLWLGAPGADPGEPLPLDDEDSEDDWIEPALQSHYLQLRAPGGDVVLSIRQQVSATPRALDDLLSLALRQEIIEQSDASLQTPLPGDHETSTLDLEHLAGRQLRTVRADDAGNLELHELAVLTEDGRDYWVVHLTSALDPAELYWQLAQSEETTLLERICQSAASRCMSPASAEDLQLAHLSENLPAGLTPRVDRRLGRGQPILFRPIHNAGRLGMIRALGVPDAGSEDSAHPLAPPALLKQRYQTLTGIAAKSDRLWTGVIAGCDAWRLDVSARGPAGGRLERKIYYVRLAAGRGLLLDLLCGRETVDELAQQVEPLVQACAASPLPPPSAATAPAAGPEATSLGAADPLALALQRGQPLVQLQSQTLDQHCGEALACYLIESEGVPIAFQIDRRLTSALGSSSEISGQSVVQFAGEPQEQLQSTWGFAPSGQEFWIAAQRSYATRGGGSSVLMERLEFNAGRLRLLQGRQPPLAEAWALPAPANLVSPLAADRYWPVTAMGEIGGPPALVYFCSWSSPPLPCWVERFSGRAADGQSQVHVYLRLRPVMNLDSRILALDKEGNVLYWHDVVESNNPTGPRRLLLRRVSAPELLQAQPGAAEFLRQWENAS